MMNRRKFFQIGIASGVSFCLFKPSKAAEIKTSANISTQPLFETLFQCYHNSSSEEMTAVEVISGEFNPCDFRHIQSPQRIEKSLVDKNKIIYMPWVKVNGKDDSEKTETKNLFVLMLLEANTSATCRCYRNQISKAIIQDNSKFPLTGCELNLSPVILASPFLLPFLERTPINLPQRPKCLLFSSPLIPNNVFYFLPYGRHTGLCEIHKVSSTEEKISIGIFNKVLKYDIIKE